MMITLDDIKAYQANFEKKTKYKVLQGVLRKSSLAQVSANQNALAEDDDSDAAIEQDIDKLSEQHE